MTNETIKKAAVLLSFFIGLVSSLQAVATGGDIFFVVIERFIVVFAISAFLVWTALTVVNSIVIGAARESVLSQPDVQIEERSGATPSLAEMFKKAHEDAVSKGQNLDLTSNPQEDVLELDAAPESGDNPEVKEFEPFKPKKLETDIDDNAR